MLKKIEKNVMATLFEDMKKKKSRLKTYLFRSVYKDWTVSLITVHGLALS